MRRSRRKTIAIAILIASTAAVLLVAGPTLGLWFIIDESRAIDAPTYPVPKAAQGCLLVATGSKGVLTRVELSGAGVHAESIPTGLDGYVTSVAVLHGRVYVYATQDWSPDDSTSKSGIYEITLDGSATPRQLITAPTIDLARVELASDPRAGDYLLAAMRGRLVVVNPQDSTTTAINDPAIDVFTNVYASGSKVVYVTHGHTATWFDARTPALRAKATILGSITVCNEHGFATSAGSWITFDSSSSEQNASELDGGVNQPEAEPTWHVVRFNGELWYTESSDFAPFRLHNLNRGCVVKVSPIGCFSAAEAPCTKPPKD